MPLPVKENLQVILYQINLILSSGNLYKNIRFI